MKKFSVLLLVTLVSLSAGCASANNVDSSVVLHYDFGEGQGSVLKDKSGKGNDGVIHGADFVKVEKGYALKLDGVDDYVDCGDPESLNLNEEITIEALVKCDGDSAFSEYACIAGKGFSSYMLSHRSNKYLYYNISGGGNSQMINIPNKEWLHITATFDKKDISIYINGKREGYIGSKEPFARKGGNFYIARTSEESRWTQNSRYKGQIALLKVYSRALQEAEIKANYKKIIPKVFKPVLKLKPYILYSDQQLLLEVDPSGLGDFEKGSYAILKLSSDKCSEKIEKKVILTSSDSKIDVSYNFGKLAAGDYTITSQAYTSDNKNLGKKVSFNIEWPSKPSWKKNEDKVKIRNNFVSELLEISSKDELEKSNAFKFTNPRKGWIYFEVNPEKSGLEKFEMTVNGESIEDKTISLETGAPNGKLQSMQHFEKGEYHVKLSKEAITSLSIRSMPEIILVERGPVARKRYPDEINILLNEINVTLENFQRFAQEDKMATEDINDQHEWLDKWRKSGRRSIMHCKAPGYDGTGSTGVDIEQSYEFWNSSAGLVYLDGVIIDEFGYGTKESYPYWVEAVKRIKADPARTNKNFYGFTTGADWAKIPKAKEFQLAIRDLGYYFAPEIYLAEQATEAETKKFLHNRIRQEMLEWQEEIPNSISNIVVNLGCCSKHSFNMNTWPTADYRVFYDMQLNILANDPLFFNLRGVTAWVIRYADPENLRWMAKLYRHYCIEGKRNLLSEEYGLTYNLDYIANPDFEDGLSNWNVQEAGEIKVDSINGYGSARDFWKAKHGNSFCVMKKSKDKPNIISQTVKNLLPGKLYSVKLVSSDYADLMANNPVKKINGINISVDNAEMIEDLSVQTAYVGSSSLPPHMPQKRPYFNWHFKVFRAKDTTATLKISDWESSDTPGEPLEQSVMFNFVEVQSYLDND